MSPGQLSAALDELYTSYLQQAQNDPEGIINLDADMDIILAAYEDHFSRQEYNIPFSEEFYAQFTTGNADTIFYGGTLVGHRFLYRGRVYMGGEVNYIGIGMLAAHYHAPRELLGPAVRYWNQRQYEEGEGEHNLRQIGPATYWANMGYVGYIYR
jgi:hypothetical protein